MKLRIRNMVSTRCKIVVLEIFKKLHIQVSISELGEVDVTGNLSREQRVQLKKELIRTGFDLIEGKKELLVDKIRNIIIEFVHRGDGFSKFKFSVYLSRRLGRDYTYLATIFSAKQKITIEKFMIAHRIERVKELITYGEYNITEIAWKMNYSSLAHLSNQFKKHTGISPSCFKQLRNLKRKPLDEIGKTRDSISHASP